MNIDCDEYQNRSPENPDCGWCRVYRINLDPAGQICGMCRGDAAFRETLTRQTAVRCGNCTATTSYCDVFDTVTDPAQCARCREDGLFRAFLFGQFRSRQKRQRKERIEGCLHRRDFLREETRSCCGGREKTVRVHACVKRGEAHEGVCAECAEWAAG